MSKHDKDEAFLKAVNEELDQRAKAIDNPTREALRGMRKQAIDLVNNRQGRSGQAWALPYWRSYPRVAVAAGILLTMGVILRISMTASIGYLPELEDLAMLSTSEEISLYQDLEFYQWLDSEIDGKKISG